MPHRIVALPVFLLAAIARATVTEPNGMQVPVNSGGEVQLFQLFQQRGEAIDWQKDAHTIPAVFSPRCGFTAEYVLNQAGSHYGLDWYNAVPGVMPAQLFPIVQPNSPVGTTFKGTDIVADPNYKGGLIGFALVGGQTHYSEQQWNPSCLLCAKPGPWATALIYQSSKTFGAYYVAFEDGNVNQIQFGNDGDFNDDVFFVSGVTCGGGGMPCDTGKPGVCAEGLTECDKNGQLGCKQLNAGGLETCNGLDESCNGTIDDGAMCPNGQVCDRGRCVDTCGTGEFQCFADLECDEGVCVEQGCVGKRCPAGQVCHKGACAGACDGIVCPGVQVCRLGRCVDPCAGAACGKDTVCVGGVCVPTCTCKQCTMGLACDKGGQCVDPKCLNVPCPGGQHCRAGACVDDCDGAVCPRSQSCRMGQCIDDEVADLAMAPGSNDLAAGADPGDGGEAKRRPAGCGCRVGKGSGSGGITSGWMVGLLLGAFLHCRSRRRKREGTELQSGKRDSNRDFQLGNFATAIAGIVSSRNQRTAADGKAGKCPFGQADRTRTVPARAVKNLTAHAASSTLDRCSEVTHDRTAADDSNAAGAPDLG
ncbi:MAG: hypothetical protein EXR72_22215 [Myxococcales bacterium]|nr:hypothetical protein [Myxococcales bacterium]